MNLLWQVEPHFEDITTPEPNLEEIIYCYYKPWFSEKDAKELTQKYISTLDNLMNVGKLNKVTKTN